MKERLKSQLAIILKNQKILISDDQIEKLVGIMLDYIEMSGGFLNE